jgi:hypothetical protein
MLFQLQVFCWSQSQEALRQLNWFRTSSKKTTELILLQSSLDYTELILILILIQSLDYWIHFDLIESQNYWIHFDPVLAWTTELILI